MRHLLEPIEIWPNPKRKITAPNKEIGLNDFYFWEGQKYGTVQSFGEIPPMEWLTNRPGWRGKALRVMSPVVRRIYERFVTGGLVLAAIMEDLPYLDNRVLPSIGPAWTIASDCACSTVCTPARSSAARRSCGR